MQGLLLEHTCARPWGGRWRQLGAEPPHACTAQAVAHPAAQPVAQPTAHTHTHPSHLDGGGLRVCQLVRHGLSEAVQREAGGGRQPLHHLARVQILPKTRHHRAPQVHYHRVLQGRASKGGGCIRPGPAAGASGHGRVGRPAHARHSCAAPKTAARRARPAAPEIWQCSGAHALDLCVPRHDFENTVQEGGGDETHAGLHRRWGRAADAGHFSLGLDPCHFRWGTSKSGCWEQHTPNHSWRMPSSRR